MELQENDDVMMLCNRQQYVVVLCALSVRVFVLCALSVRVQCRSCLSDCCQQVRWAIGDGGLNISPEGLMITPPFHQRHLLWPPFSLRKVVLSRERLPP